MHKYKQALVIVVAMIPLQSMAMLRLASRGVSHAVQRASFSALCKQKKGCYHTKECKMQVMKDKAQYVACLNDTESSLVESLKVGGVYQHYRNKQLYLILSIGRHTETEELMVVYKPLYEADTYQDSLWIRPLSMFCEKVSHEGEHVPRFACVKNKSA